MTPMERYHRDLKRPNFCADPAQEHAVAHTQRLFDDLLNPEPRTLRNIASRILPEGRRFHRQVRGLYLWGGVGRGKTYLMDGFYDSLPFKTKLRMHFHRFMQRVHTELKTLRGESEPLALFADKLAPGTKVLCFDEFHVSDIADAMLLGGLCKALFERGVTLVATSNDAPDNLYANGLQRERFLPAIALIKQNTEMFKLETAVDYRLRALEQAEIYHCPLDAAAEQNLRSSFSRLAPDLSDPCDIPDPSEPVNVLSVDGRVIKTVRCAEGVVWFEFEELCGGLRAAADYIEIASCYHTVLLANIPQLHDGDDDKARRFIALIDELYDRNVKLIVSAAVPPAELYRGERLATMFQRTASRLQEMQSLDYLGRQHLAAA
jgi:cell division protein ZapE